MHGMDGVPFIPIPNLTMFYPTMSGNVQSLKACQPGFRCLGRPLNLTGPLSPMSTGTDMRGRILGTIILAFVGLAVVAVLHSSLRHSLSIRLLRKPLPPSMFLYILLVTETSL